MSMMPIGIPKVPYKMPIPFEYRSKYGGFGQTHGPPEWVDIYSRLQRERILFISSEIDDESANTLIAMLLYLDNDNSKQPIYLYVISLLLSICGGTVIAHIRSDKQPGRKRTQWAGDL
jgi:ATP-dependent Clp protease protease subunit